MARYNSVNSTSSVAGGSTISTPASGLLTTLTGSGTVTIPNPVYYTGQTQAFYNSTGSAITLSTPSGNFTGAGASGNGNLTVPGSSVVTVVSDGANYIVQAWIGGTITVGGTLTANGAVSLNPTGLNVSIQPTGAGVLTLSSGTKGSLDNVDIGTTTAGNAKFGTLESSGVTKITASTAATAYTNGALIVSGGVGIAGNVFVNNSIKAGSADATTGTIIIQANYSNGSLTTFGTEYSSGGPSLGYAVYPSSSAPGAFLSATGAASLQRAAYNMNGNTHNWYAGAAQTVAIGSSASLYNAMSLSTTALTVSNAANVIIANPNSSATNSQSAPGYLQFTGNGWNTLAGSTQYQGQIALGGTYSSGTGSVEPAITFSLAGTGNSGYNAGAGPTALTERVRITNYGFVGIKTLTPQAELDLNGNLLVRKGIFVSESAATTIAGDNVNWHHIGYAGGANYHITGSTTGDLTVGAIPGSNIVFGTVATGQPVPLTRVTIAASGAVTIAQTLQVNANLTANNTLSINSSSYLGVSGGSYMSFYTFAVYGGNQYMHFKTNLRNTTSQMYVIEARGYDYGSGSSIAGNWCGYMYSPNGVSNPISNSVSNWGNQAFCNNQYLSTDGYLVLVGNMSSYYCSCTFNSYSTAQGIFSMQITATSQITTSTGGF